MKVRLLNKVANAVYNAAIKGDFELAYGRLLKINPKQQRKVLSVFNRQAFERLGVENGANIVADFAGYRGLQSGLKQVGGTKGLSQSIIDSIDLHLTDTINIASKRVIDELPKSQSGWAKLMLKDSWVEAKRICRKPADKAKKYIKNKFDLSKSKNKTSPLIKTAKPKKTALITKNIPNEYKTIFANLEGKTGQEFVDTAYENMVNHMKLNGIAPKSISITGADGVMSVNGGYDYVSNTIRYSQSFVEKCAPQQQINLLSHELKHCEQFTNILRTENIGVSEYARTIAENSLKQSLSKSSFDFMLKSRYEQALKQGKGEEFIQKTVDNWTKDLIPQIETNFAEVLKLPKIKANSPEGIKAVQDLKAMRNYEGLDAFGFGSETYKNNPLEVEAYAFGDSIEKIFKGFIS